MAIGSIWLKKVLLMVSAFRLIRVLVGSCFLCLGLTNCQFNAAPTRDAGWTADTMKMGPSDPRPMTKSMKGEVLRVEGTNYVVKREDGEEVSVYADSARLTETYYVKQIPYVLAGVLAFRLIPPHLN